MTLASGQDATDVPQALLLFVHLLGLLGFVTGLVTYLTVLGQLRRARSVGHMRVLLLGMKWGERAAVGGVAAILAAGTTMTVQHWSFSDAWIVTSLVLMACIAVIGRFTVDSRVQRLRKTLEHLPDGPASDELVAAASDPVMSGGAAVMVMLLIEIIFLMTLKPGFTGSALSALMTAALCNVAYLPALRTRGGTRTRGGSR